MKKYYVIVNDRGYVYWYKDAKCTVLHRENGPAVEAPDGRKEWFINGQRHREDGPAFIWDAGESWFLHGVNQRNGGPANVYKDGKKEWMVHGQFHREDGPAVEYADGRRAWYLYGKLLTEAQFNARINPTCIDKTITIDGVNYKLTPV